MQPHDLDLIYQALAASADELTDPRLDGGNADGTSFERRLGQVTRAALDNVPGADCVGLTMQGHDGTLSSFGQTSTDIVELDRLQVVLGEGPCVEAVSSGAAPVVEVADFRTESTRWARFSAVAAEQGMRSLLSFAMAPRGATPGAVNIYSHTPGSFDDLAKAIAGGFAMQAAIVVYGAERVTQLERALQSRDIIGQAKGILMQRDGIDADAAFAKLVSASQATNMKRLASHQHEARRRRPLAHRRGRDGAVRPAARGNTATCRFGRLVPRPSLPLSSTGSGRRAERSRPGCLSGVQGAGLGCDDHHRVVHACVDRDAG